jgi:hypothetical protein
MSIQQTLANFRRGRTVANTSTGKVIGTIDGTALANLGFRGSKFPVLTVRVRRTDGGRQILFDSRHLTVI